ncbi:MAG TPA: enoyl-CoA hydratase/isomerase family protein [Saprospiraceae bacterium]|nr:enoyl-CoA hydratase/isomerase family protein [Saprospiraceae bacterium]
MKDSTIEQGSIDLEIENGIATISFYHPAHNSMPGQLLRELSDVITDVGKTDDILVVVLKSQGDKTFCAGASFDELISIEDQKHGKKFFMGFANVINAMRKCPKFIIGRVQGKAIGGGVGIASATDICYATRNASVKLSELAVGIGPFVVGPAVEHKIGVSAMSQLTINATVFQTAEWAMQKGLYAELYDSTVDMDAAIQLLCQQLVLSNPEAMRMLKKVFWEGTDEWDELLEKRAEKSGKLVLSDFTRNAIEKFKR